MAGIPQEDVEADRELFGLSAPPAGVVKERGKKARCYAKGLRDILAGDLLVNEVLGRVRVGM